MTSQPKNLLVLLDEIKTGADRSWFIPATDVIKARVKKLIRANPGFTDNEIELMKGIVGGFGAALLRAAAPSLGIAGLASLGAQNKSGQDKLAELRAVVAQRMDVSA